MIRPSCAVAKLAAAVASSTVCPVAWATAETSAPKASTHSAKNSKHTSKTQKMSGGVVRVMLAVANMKSKRLRDVKSPEFFRKGIRALTVNGGVGRPHSTPTRNKKGPNEQGVTFAECTSTRSRPCQVDFVSTARLIPHKKTSGDAYFDK